MIEPYIMTTEQVKTYLALYDTTYDTQINAYLPVVSDDLCRTNGICNQTFLIEGTADVDGTTELSNVSLTTDEWSSLYIGAVVRINSEDGVIASYDEDSETITLESALTTTATEMDLEIRNFPTGAKATVSQMISYRISQGSFNGGMNKEVASKSVGGLSVSFVNGASGAVSAYGYPEAIMNSLRTIRRPRFM